MGCSLMDVYVAKNKMKIKNCTYALSFVTTLWKGEVIMCSYNTIEKAIANVYCFQILEPEDFEELENIIGDFIYGGN